MDIKRSAGVTDCGRITRSDVCEEDGGVAPRLRDFWSSTAQCSYASCETPLGWVYDSLHSNDRGDPSLLAMYREPVARCRSSWAYDVLWKNVGNLSHEHYVRLRCASHYVGRFFGLPIRANRKASALYQRGRDNPQAAAHEVLRWLLRRLDFVGISERYDASLCLLWYVTGQRRQFQKACPCDSPHRRKGLGKHTNSMTRLTAEINLTHTPAHLNVSDAYIEGLAQADILLYRALDAVFVANVRRVESITRTQLLCE
jgi:hypothetical protein